jgi:SAM-dependent methyltransferase
MSKISDQAYLLTDQYQNAVNLNTRIQLHARFSVNKYGWHRWIFDQFELAPDSRVLELGCGPGDLWFKNLDRIPAGWKITLSDFSPGMLAVAQQNLRGYRRQFEYEVIDGQAIPYEDQIFDAVIANHMLYHVPDVATALAEIHRVLKPGGGFYASTVGKAHMRELDQLAHQFKPDVELIFDNDQTHAFILDNGQAQLSAWFPQVALYRYQDALEITEAEPLVAYVLSMARLIEDYLVGDKVTEFTKFIEQELAQKGVIHVTKDTGLFVAQRADS